MEDSKNSINEFYHNHSKTRRVTPRVIKLSMFLPPLIGGKRVIDVGCGNRMLTDIMSLYAHVTGIDIEEDITEYKTDKKYDVVTCLDVLEHIPEDKLGEALRNLWRLCLRGGYVVINLPEQQDESQPLDRKIKPIELITKYRLFDMKLVKLQWFKITDNESYNFMVFRRMY